MIGQRAHQPVACPECGAADRFTVVAQQVSVDVARLAVRVEHVIVACKCKNAFDVTRAGITRYKGQTEPAEEAQPTPAANSKPQEESDTDLPRAFRGKR